MKIPRWKIILAYIALLIACALWCYDCYGQNDPFYHVRHKSYDVYYDMQAMSPVVVTYDVQLSDFAGNVKVGSRHFKKDTQLPRPWVQDADYEKSGYVRGHMCAAGFRDSDKALMKDTYYCSNICPMTMVCNSGAWKVQEDFIRSKCSDGCKFKVVCVANFSDADTIRLGKHGVLVPSSFVRLCVCTEHSGEVYTMMAINDVRGGQGRDMILNELSFANILDGRAKDLAFYILQAYFSSDTKVRSNEKKDIGMWPTRVSITSLGWSYRYPEISLQGK